MKPKVSDATVTLEDEGKNRLRVQSSMNYEEYVQTYDRPPRCPLIRPIPCCKNQLEELENFQLEPEINPKSKSAIELSTAKYESMLEISCAEKEDEEREDVEFEDEFDDDQVSEENHPIQRLQVMNTFNNKFEAEDRGSRANSSSNRSEEKTGKILEIIERRDRTSSVATSSRKKKTITSNY